jgi:hypothetical protein
MSIAADKGIPQLRPSSIVLPTFSLAEYYYLTGEPIENRMQIWEILHSLFYQAGILSPCKG